MTTERPLPTALNIVAVLFLLVGLISAGTMIYEVFQRSFHLNFGVLGLPIFFGLRQLNRGWRSCALVCLGVSMLLTAIVVVLGFTATTPAEFGFRDRPMAEIDARWLSAIGGVLFLLTVWQYRVLVRPDVRALFHAAAPCVSVSSVDGDPPPSAGSAAPRDALTHPPT